MMSLSKAVESKWRNQNVIGTEFLEITLKN